uniref:NADH-ubiquinone oxidoreductase chain 4L n=1 Tax=Eophreatoicus karrkkanj TaxID=496899 RepID=D3U713_9CRUS|nr:NADH dehydrogenase subunit 4L [Eophreatoicus sp. 14 FK-2009]ACN72771.1 NADH dehydrogenase subunit 4L [Eophreatoicus karrkkanj]
MLQLSSNHIMLLMLFSFGVMGFMFSWSHILNTLISLEFMVLSIFLTMELLMTGDIKETYLILFFLSIAACEGALGLSIMVSFTRSKGTELSDNSNILLW